MPMNPRLMRPISVAYHPEALAWRTAVLANGGSVGSSLKPVSDFCRAIDAAGIRSKFLRLNLLVGGNLSAARVPLYRGASSTGTQYGGTVDVNNGPFVSGDYSEATGLVGNGTTKYLDTGLTFASLIAFGMHYDDDHACAYVRTPGAGTYLGGVDTGDQSSAYELAYDGLGVTFYSGDPFGDASVNGLSTQGGMFIGQRTASSFSMFRNNVDITNSSTSGYQNDFDWPLTPPKVLVFAQGNATGTNGNESSATLAAYSIGTAFATSAQRTAYYNAMLTLQTALGRNV